MFHRALAGLLGLGMLLAASPALAQACCAGAGVFSPARLKLGEDGLLGLQLHARDLQGSLDGAGDHVADPSGTSELDLEQDLLATLRVAEQGQLGLSIPIVETRRVVPGLGELGGGAGDLGLSGRYELISTGTSEWPGVAILAGLTFPTGRPVELAHHPLSTDATGTGSFQGSLGLEVEHVLGPFMLNGSAVLAQRSARTVGELEIAYGPQLAAAFALGYAIYGEAGLALTVATTWQRPNTLQGVADAHGRGLTTVGLAGGLPLSESWRIQGTVFDDLPVLGRNQPVGWGGTLTLIRSWL